MSCPRIYPKDIFRHVRYMENNIYSTLENSKKVKTIKYPLIGDF